MKEEKNDLKARLILANGREVWWDGEGQFVDVESGAADDARSAARRHLVAAVRRQRGEVDGLYDAWGYVVEALTEIALEGDGAKSTAAAKFVAQAAGMMEEEEEEPAGPDNRTVLGRELALGVLGLALGEKGGRDGEEG